MYTSIYEHEMMAECVWHNYYRLCYLVTLTCTSVPGCLAWDILDLGLYEVWIQKKWCLL